MLSEVFILSRALEDAGIYIEAQHPNIKQPGISTGPIIRVCLNAEGVIVRCEGVVKENYAGLWAHFDGNHNSFPVIRLSEPLMDLPNIKQTPSKGGPKGRNKAKVDTAEYRAELQNKIAQAVPRALSDNTINLFLRLHNKASMLAETLEGDNEAIVRICRAFKMVVPVETKCLPLLEALREKAIQWINYCNEDELKALEVLLFTASGETGRKKIQLALDTDDVCTTIYRSEIRRMVASAFLRKDNTSCGTSNEEESLAPLCAYTGSTDLWSGPFPKVKLPVLGREFCIFSMFSAAECNIRYRLKDSQIIPVAKIIVLKMQDSLKAIVAPEREGKTWRSIASEKPENYDLLIAYVDGQPDIPALIADFFGENTYTSERQFTADASAVCEALDGVLWKQPGSRLNLFILRKASEGQAFVALAETPTVEEVLRGAEWWQAAAMNVPLGSMNDSYIITLPILNQEKKPEQQKPVVPYPGQIASLLTQAWIDKRDSSKGKQKASMIIRGAAFGELLNMMLQRQRTAEEAAAHVLSLCLVRASPLLCELGGCRGKRTTTDGGLYGDRERQIALRAVSTLGITLYALGSKKEDYMHEAAFQIGQVLHLADRLHRCYCTVVRDGSIPPNLIGNTHFNAALDNPENALAILAERFRIYQGWAEAVKPGSYPSSDKKEEREKHFAVLEAKKILSYYKPLAIELHRQGIPQECTDVMKAHLLLGYLADIVNKPKTEGEDK